MALLMADRLNLPLIELNSYVIDKDVIELVSEKTARKYLVIPLFKMADSLTLAMANPKDIEAIDTVKLKSKCSIIDPVLSSPGEINKAIEKYYSASGNVEDVIKSISDKQDIEEEQEIEEKDILELVEEAPIVKLVNLIISKKSAFRIEILLQGRLLL